MPSGNYLPFLKWLQTCVGIFFFYLKSILQAKRCVTDWKYSIGYSAHDKNTFELCLILHKNDLL